MSNAIHIALFGAAGRMGREIMRQSAEFDRLQIKYGYDPAGAAQYFGQLQIEPPPGSLKPDVKLAIDYSLAKSVPANVKLAVRSKAAYLCGVTALERDALEALHKAGETIPVLCAPNMSPGMNLLFALAAKAAALPDYERRIIEIHHDRKVDAPSGSAKRLAFAIDSVAGGETNIDSLRMGDVIGEHTLILGGPGERIEITHRADDRSVFAKGTLRAAQWLIDRQPGFYSMADVLGI